MPMRRRRYREWYDLRAGADSASGTPARSVAYRGAYYAFSKPGQRRKLTRHAAALLGVNLLLFVGAGLLNNEGSRCFYVLPFYLFAVFPLAYWGRALAALLRAPDPMTEPQKERSTGRLARSCAGLAVLCGLCACGDAVLLFTGGAADRVEREVLFLLANAAIAWAGLRVARVARACAPVKTA